MTPTIEHENCFSFTVLIVRLDVPRNFGIDQITRFKIANFNSKLYFVWFYIHLDVNILESALKTGGNSSMHYVYN